MMERCEVALAARRQFLSTSYFPALDGLRCVAICAVIWHHSLPRAVPGWLGRGHVGVPLFFALSGFLITTLLLAERHATGTIAIGHFWMRRCLRIFPLYYTVLLLFVASLAWRPPDEARSHFFESLPFYASYTSNWFVDYGAPHPIWFGFAWSLSTEEQFYVWWPPLLRRCQRWGGWATALALTLLLGLDQLAERGMFAAWLAPESERILTTFSGALGLGALLAVLMASDRAFPWVWRCLGARGSAVACSLLVGALVWRPTGPPILLELGLVGLVGASVFSPGDWLRRGLSARPLVQVGRVSYGMYLFHVPVIGLLRRLCPWLLEEPLVLFAAACSVSFCLARLSYRHFEGPILALKERFRPSERPASDPNRARLPARS
jgi:peptidoglycan/LPS O-acetylase OafA/YrhL